MKIGVTGGIGTGKSYVCALLKERGIEVYDCDQAAKRLMHHSTKLREQITALIGNDAYLEGGELNKPVVAKFLLTSELHAKALNAIVHPAVIDDFMQSGLNWMESAILFESGIDRLMDCVVCVTAPEEVRIERIVRRDGITPEKARQWMGRQWDQQLVVDRADYQIVNDGHTPLPPQLDKLQDFLAAKEAKISKQNFSLLHN